MEKISIMTTTWVAVSLVVAGGGIGGALFPFIGGKDVLENVNNGAIIGIIAAIVWILYVAIKGTLGH